MEICHIVGPSPLFTNTFLLFTAAGHAVAIDPAAPAARYLDALAQHHAQLTHILLTHGHYDHVGAVRQLRQATGAQVFLDTADALADTMYPLSTVDCDASFSQQKDLQIDELTFRGWHTPGHTKGSWCLLCENCFFTGDTLFAGSCGRTDLEGGSMTDMAQSLALLHGLSLPDETQVLPGHMDFSTMGAERRQNPYLRGEVY
jgi:glyoxylase-like metal-dependent hydrolase (beta-lactamase superfamily II)